MLGAKDFLNYANEQGVQIYYVSDREQSQLKATIKNLTAEGLPQAEREHILLKQKQAKTKEQRRQQVAQQADVIMLFGDDLSDFNDPAENTVADRTNVKQTSVTTK